MNVPLEIRSVRTKVSRAGFFVTGAKARERGQGVYVLIHDQPSKRPTKPDAKKTCEFVLGYMVKRLSAYGGCLGSKRR